MKKLIVFIILPIILFGQFKIRTRASVEVNRILPLSYGFSYLGDKYNTFDYGYFDHLFSDHPEFIIAKIGHIYNNSDGVRLKMIFPDANSFGISSIGLYGVPFDWGYFHNINSDIITTNTLTVTNLNIPSGYKVKDGALKYNIKTANLDQLTSLSTDTLVGIVPYRPIMSYNTKAMTGSNSKRGGLVLRGDDDGGDERARIFLKYINAGIPFLWAVNLGTGRDTDSFVKFVRTMQAMGIECVDHTPNHDVYYYVGEPYVSASTPGVRSISNDTTYLDYVWDGTNNNMTVNAVTLLLQASLHDWKKYNLTQPRVWIHPGTNPTYRVRTETLAVASKPLGYLSGATYVGYVSRKTYNEDSTVAPYDMQWNDFNIFTNTFASQKHIIADGIAQHRIIFEGDNHFADTDQYRSRVDSLIDFIRDNDILVLKQEEWSNILYRQKADPYVNVIPNLYTDIDVNGQPDGWNTISSLSKTVGRTEDKNHSLYVSSATQFCIISHLGGIEKGNNGFGFWVKGVIGTKVRAIFVSEQTSATPSDTLTFTTTTSNWQHFTEMDSDNGNTDVIFDKDVSLITFKMDVTNYINGTVYLSGVELAKKRW